MIKKTNLKLFALTLSISFTPMIFAKRLKSVIPKFKIQTSLQSSIENSFFTDYSQRRLSFHSCKVKGLYFDLKNTDGTSNCSKKAADLSFNSPTKNTLMRLKP